MATALECIIEARDGPKMARDWKWELQKSWRKVQVDSVPLWLLSLSDYSLRSASSGAGEERLRRASLTSVMVALRCGFQIRVSQQRFCFKEWLDFWLPANRRRLAYCRTGDL